MAENMEKRSMLSILVTVIATLFAAYHLINIVYPFQASLLNQNTHLAFALTLTFLNRLAAKKMTKKQSIVELFAFFVISDKQPNERVS